MESYQLKTRLRSFKLMQYFTSKDRANSQH